MPRAIDTFRENLLRVRSIHALHASMAASVTSVIDLSDLLRAEVVLLVSALDYYVHEVTRIGMIDIWNGSKPATTAYLRFGISIDVARHLASQPISADHLENEIRTRHGFLAFQHPDKIADAIRLISNIELWNEVALTIGVPAATVKTQLKLLVERRNKIAHEADIDPSFPGQRWPIHRRDTEDALVLVQQIVEAIDQLVA